MRRPRFGGLRSQILVVVVVVLLPFVVMAGLFVLYRYDAERRLAQGQVRDAAGEVQTRYQVWLARTEEFLASFSSRLTVSGFDGNPDCALFGQGLARVPETYRNVVVTDANGQIVCARSPLPDGFPRNLGDQSSFRAARRSQGFQALTLDEGTIGELRRLPVAYPRHDGNLFLGVIFATVSLEEFGQLAQSVPLPESGVTTVYDRVGNVVFRSASAERFVGSNQANEEVFATADRKGPDATFEAGGIDGVHRLYATADVVLEGSAPPFVVVTGAPTSVVYASADRIRNATLLGLLLVSAAGLAIAWVGADLLVLRPVRALQTRAQRVASGEADAPTREIKGALEMRSLARSLERMTTALQDRATRLETSRQRLRTLVDTLPAVTFLMTPDLTSFTEMSGQLESLLGPTAQEVLEDPFAALGALSPDDRDRWMATARTSLSSGTTTTIELPFVYPAGGEGWAQFHFSPAFTSEGELLGVQGVAFAVTDLVVAREELARSNAVLEERVHSRTAELARVNTELSRANRDLANTNEELEAFSYSVSHDLRAPLRAISGFAQLLVLDHSDKLDDEGMHLIERVQRAAGRMGTLIDDLLSLAQVGRSALEVGPIDLTGLAREVLDRRVHSQPDRAAEIKIQDGLEVHGDPILTRVLMENLAENAWKFTGNEQRAVIEVGSLHERDNQGRQVFFVRDNGVGFDMTYVDKLFEPFQRLHTPEEFEGTGIGLAIVARIVTRHDGRVWATSELGEGTTVYFQLARPPGMSGGDRWSSVDHESEVE